MSRLRSFAARVKRRFAPNRYYANPQSYWERRHSAYGTSLEGVGRIHMTEAANESAYHIKWSHVENALKLAGAPGTLLDAGCGSGWFTQRFVEMGYKVTAFDFTASGIAAAKERVSGDVTWVVSDIASYRSDHSHPLVVCIDVLFHIVDDSAWIEAVSNLGALAAGGVLIIQDHLIGQPLPPPITTPGTYHTRWRTLEDYQAVLAGAVLEAHDLYELPMEDATKDLLVFRVPPVDTSKEAKNTR